MKHRVAAIQMTSGHDVKANLLSAEGYIQQAVDKGAQLIVLPEMFALMGLDQMDKVKTREKFGAGQIQDFLSQQARKHHIWLVGGTIPIEVSEKHHKVHASCLVYDDEGKVVGRYDKIHMFDVKLRTTQETYQESGAIEAGENIVVIQSPFGKLGLAVCYDVRFPELFRIMHDQGVEVVILPAAFIFETGAVHWDILVRARAIENQVYMIAAGQTGFHTSGRKTYGHSMVVDPWGEVKSTLAAEPGVVIADIDIDYLKELRNTFPVLMHRRVRR